MLLIISEGVLAFGVETDSGLALEGLFKRVQFGETILLVSRVIGLGVDKGRGLELDGFVETGVSRLGEQVGVLGDAQLACLTRIGVCA